jgi:predicted nucleic acid-binding protein
VEVTLIEPSNGRPPRGSPQAALASSAKWVGPPDEADRILDEMRREKWADVDSQLAAIARVNDLVLLTADAHSQNVRDLKSENWVTAAQQP